MKALQNSIKTTLALLLVFCLLISQVPALAATPQAESEVPEAGDTYLVAKVKQLNADNGGTITLDGGIYRINKPLIISTTIKIKGSGTILPLGDNWATVGGDDSNGPYGTMISIQGKQGKLIIEGDRITIDPSLQCRAISVTSGASLHLSGCTITRGQISGTQQGAGVYVGEDSYLTATGDTRFIHNIGDTGTATSGGALYIGLNAGRQGDGSSVLLLP